MKAETLNKFIAVGTIAFLLFNIWNIREQHRYRKAEWAIKYPNNPI